MINYKSRPDSTKTLPDGISYIVGNEVAERFSYYGMRAILVTFMTQYLLNSSGQSDVMSANEAQGYFHLFVSIVYFMPFFGALLADGLLGKYRTIIFLSLVYCLGHFVLAIDNTRMGLVMGQGLIAAGAGGIKPCVSAHIGDQFGIANQHLMSTVFGWFYFAINFGAFTAMLIIPWLLEYYGATVAFAVPGFLMLLATITFWLGRYRFVHIQPAGINFIKEMCSQVGIRSLCKLSTIYAFIAVFWALFDQTGSSWIVQAQKMDRMVFGFELLPSQIQAANPLFIMLLVPFFFILCLSAAKSFFCINGLTKNDYRFIFNGYCFCYTKCHTNAVRQGPNAAHNFAVIGLRLVNFSRSYGFDNLPRVFLHASPKNYEIFCDGILFFVSCNRKSFYQCRKFLYSKRRWNDQACWRKLLLVFYRINVVNSIAVYVCE